VTGLLEVAALAGLVFAAGAWLVVVLFAPRDHAGGARTSPGHRLVVGRAWLYAPLWVPVALVTAAMAPGILGALVGEGDHCLGHGGHHHHLCPVHPPHVAEGELGWLLPLSVALAVGAIVAVTLRRALREARLVRALVATSRPSILGDDVRLLDRPEPIALTVGWRRRTILVSVGLVESLDAEALAVVLAHERAHVSRGDTRLALLDRLAAALLPRSAAAPLLGRVALAREQACDAEAAREVGGPLAVARTLAMVLRLRMSAPPIGVSMASSTIEARVVQLLDPPRPSRRRLALALIGLATLLAVGAGPLHTAIEHLITAALH